ncbi:MAG: hypothetical protein RLY71_2216 [Pseudomonadota bacterium]|jgi:hypothetical protein
MRTFGYLVVEGPHDVEFCYRLLSGYGLHRVRLLSELDVALQPLVPRNFPHNGDLQKRVPVPLFLQNDHHGIAIDSAGGDSRLVPSLQETLATVDQATFVGMGLMLDSDKNQSTADRYAALRKQVDASTSLVLPVHAGNISSGPPRLGAYVLPDNVNPGTLEDLLLDSAATQYSALLPAATRYVDDTLAGHYIPRDHCDEIMKPAGRNKAVIGAMSALFKPGKAVQMSIQDNDWLRGAALALPRIQAVQDFLAELFELMPRGTHDARTHEPA